ncbi:hypothetical protein [Rugamonas aquatica]|uniref:Uncharacterized protein n=1 Tax=Rugamonas aquatica TaxID=2743357 RepID=A0A6A7MY40_9BURK|nr:hypothetical protein [Rugamonas aquatica]MQA37676.1 hypothetical protein [Rugamonas aquatica]
MKPPDAPASAGGYVAHFTDADSTQLYWPKPQLTDYCAAHGGVMRVDRYFVGNAVYPARTEHTPERSKLEHPYLLAADEGAANTAAATRPCGAWKSSREHLPWKPPAASSK